MTRVKHCVARKQWHLRLVFDGHVVNKYYVEQWKEVLLLGYTYLYVFGWREMSTIFYIERFIW